MKKTKPQKRTIALRVNYAQSWVYENNREIFARLSEELLRHVNDEGIIPSCYEIIVRPEVIVQQKV